MPAPLSGHHFLLSDVPRPTDSHAVSIFDGSGGAGGNPGAWPGAIPGPGNQAPSGSPLRGQREHAIILFRHVTARWCNWQHSRFWFCYSKFESWSGSHSPPIVFEGIARKALVDASRQEKVGASWAAPGAVGRGPAFRRDPPDSSLRNSNHGWARMGTDWIFILQNVSETSKPNTKGTTMPKSTSISVPIRGIRG